MNTAIILKTARDTAPVCLLAGLGTIAFVVLFSYTMLNMGQEVLEFASKFAFLRRMLEAGLGINVSGEISINILFAVCFTHLVVLALAWALIISTVTRVSVGEVERGTADLLFSLPLTRWEVCNSSTIVWVASALLVSVCPFLGVAIGRYWFVTDESVNLGKFLPVVANLCALHLAVGGMCTFFAAVFNRRGHAIAAVIGIALLSATLNFVEPFLKPLADFPYLSLLHYFRPVEIVRAGAWPWANILVLSIFGGVSWFVGTALFCRKDIPVS